MKIRWYALLVLLLGVLIVALKLFLWQGERPFPVGQKTHPEPGWNAGDTTSIPHTPDGNLIRYGRQLITNTAYYLGPNGVAGKYANAMNCGNCHVAAGTDRKSVV